MNVGGSEPESPTISSHNAISGRREQLWRAADDAFTGACLQEAAVQCRKQPSLWLKDKEELLKQLLDWAFGGFQPAGPDRDASAVSGESPFV